ncbi:MAG: hypothetical protein VW685_05115, partial [Ilumatobacter sp.]
PARAPSEADASAFLRAIAEEARPKGVRVDYFSFKNITFLFLLSRLESGGGRVEQTSDGARVERRSVYDCIKEVFVFRFQPPRAAFRLPVKSESVVRRRRDPSNRSRRGERLHLLEARGDGAG